MAIRKGIFRDLKCQAIKPCFGWSAIQRRGTECCGLGLDTADHIGGGDTRTVAQSEVIEEKII